MDVQETLKFHILYHFRYDHLCGLKGFPVPATWIRTLFSFGMSCFFLTKYIFQGLTVHPLSLVADSFFAGRKMNTQNCGQSSVRVNKRSTRTPEAWTKTRPPCPSLKTSRLWSLLTWVSLPRPPAKQDFGFWVVKGILETQGSLI